MKWLYVILIALLTFYGPAELSRYILAYGLDRELLFELVVMWGLFLTAMVIVYKTTGGRHAPI